jgi:DNA repair photolyase
METITRKSLLYKSGIGGYCINHVLGCSHACLYPCYAFMMAHSYGRISTYADWCQPKLVANAAELVTKKLAGMKVKPDSIHLCLSTDPFMNGYPEVADMSMKLIAIINSHGIRCSTLTKGKIPNELTDRNRFSENNIYGISLISLNEDFRNLWEPGAAAYTERIASLKYLHDCGLQTLAHIEPYPTPNLVRQNLQDLLEAVGFVDQIYFSGWNYNKQIKQFHNHEQFYKDQSTVVQRFCKKRGITYNY